MSDELKIIPLSWGNKPKKVKPDKPIKSLIDRLDEIQDEQEEEDQLIMKNCFGPFDFQ